MDSWLTFSCCLIIFPAWVEFSWTQAVLLDVPGRGGCGPGGMCAGVGYGEGLQRGRTMLLVPSAGVDQGSAPVMFWIPW